MQAQAIEQAHREWCQRPENSKDSGSLPSRRNHVGYAREDRRSHDSIPMWDACGQLNLPVAIHVSDPIAFFTPTDRFNERYEGIEQPSGLVFSWRRFSQQRGIARCAQSSDGAASEDAVRACFTQETSRRICRTSRRIWTSFPTCSSILRRASANWDASPLASRKFFDKYQDRILFATDATPHGDEFPQQVFNDQLYEIYFRFLETEDEYFDYAPAKIPPQGRWRIYGINLPDADSTQGVLRELCPAVCRFRCEFIFCIHLRRFWRFWHPVSGRK